MKKRVVILVVAGLLALTVNGFAMRGTYNFGIGAEVTSVNFNDVGAMATFHIPNVPLFFGIGANFTSDLTLAMTVDYWLLNRPVTGILWWYLGAGAYGAWGVDEHALGVRMPVGLQVWPLNNEFLELFVELAPAWIPITSEGIIPGNLQTQFALGFRFWP